MKKAMVMAVLAVALVGCKTTGKVLDTVHAAAETGPAVIADARALTDKAGSVWNGLGVLWDKFSLIWKPTTNAPAAN